MGAHRQEPPPVRDRPRPAGLVCLMALAAATCGRASSGPDVDTGPAADAATPAPVPTADGAVAPPGSDVAAPTLPDGSVTTLAPDGGPEPDAAIGAPGSLGPVGGACPAGASYGAPLPPDAH